MYNSSMALHINNPAVEQEIRALAADTGETLTEAIGTAVRERRRKLRSKVHDPDVYEKIMAIARHAAALPRNNTMTDEELLGYDENGLPT
jgi:antitoxin VapB